MPRRARVLQHPQVALADQRPAAAAIANKLHHVHSAFFQLRKFEVALNPPQRAFIVVKHLLTRGRQPVKVDGRVHRLEVARVVVEGVELKHPHNQLLHVLHVDLQAHRIARPVKHLVHRRKIQVDAVLQRLHLARAEHRVPALRVTHPVDQLGLREDVLQVRVAHVRQVLLKVRVLPEKAQEKIAHQPLVRPNRRQTGDVAVIRVQVHVRDARPLQERRAVLHIDVPHRPRQLQIFPKQHPVVPPLAALEPQQVVNRIGLQGIVRRRQPPGELVNAV